MYVTGIRGLFVGSYRGIIAWWGWGYSIELYLYIYLDLLFKLLPSDA